MLKANLNILVITARADFGGGPEHLYNLLKLLSQNFNFFVACPNDYPYKKRYSEITGWERIILIPHRKFRVKNLLELRSFIKNSNIGLIHSHGKGAGIYGRLLALLTSIPCIHTFHGLHVGKYNLLQKSLYIVFERVLSLFTKKIISVSRGEYQELIKNKIAGSSKITVIENGVNIPGVIVSDKNFHSNPKIVTTITRFDFQKNTSQLITIFVELRKKVFAGNFKVVLLGTGQEENELKVLADENGFSDILTFKGAVENPGKYLEESFCYFSTSRWEGLPLALLEAMSYGVPVIASNVTGNNDIVKHKENGFLYNIDEPEKAAEYLIQLYENYDLWKSFSISSKEIIKSRFSVQKMAEETQKLYYSIIKR